MYVHRRASDGSVFYIGKGQDNRHKSKSGRSNHWRKIVEKNGVIIEIIQRFNYEEDAYNFEISLISLMRDYDAKICNVSKGGDGGLSGIKLSDTHKEKLRMAKLGKKQMPDHARKSATAKKGKPQPRSAVDYVIGLKKKKVINSSGEIFESASEAARVFSGRLGSFCSQGNISSCCRGDRNNAYGETWSYDISISPVFKSKPSNKKTVFNNKGMSFDSVGEAVKWVASWRGAANHQCISQAARDNGSAYGHTWRYQ